jgi:hypothetical protein
MDDQVELKTANVVEKRILKAEELKHKKELRNNPDASREGRDPSAKQETISPEQDKPPTIPG